MKNKSQVGLLGPRCPALVPEQHSFPMVPSKVPSFLATSLSARGFHAFHPSCSATGLHSLKPISATNLPPAPIGNDPYCYVSTQFFNFFFFLSLQLLASQPSWAPSYTIVTVRYSGRIGTCTARYDAVIIWPRLKIRVLAGNDRQSQPSNDLRSLASFQIRVHIDAHCEGLSRFGEELPSVSLLVASG